MIECTVALTLWLLILSASTVVASLTVSKSAKKAGFAMQLTMFSLSLAVIELIGGPGKFGLGVTSDTFSKLSSSALVPRL